MPASDARLPQNGRRERPDLRILAAGLLAANLGAWIWSAAAFHGRPVLLGTALLAWVFGLRHAVDADHIAAIDNAVRKLMQAGRRAHEVGLWFSLGHSTAVALACIAVTAASATAQSRLGLVTQIGGVVSTVVSATFLLVLALANLVILRGLWGSVRALQRGRDLHGDGLAARGLLTWLLRPLLRLVTRSRHMYPIGFLFGLGFDTVTEIGLLGISATQAAQGLSLWQTLVFPALFTAAMALVDTADSVLMAGAYAWAYVNPLRKLWYNLTITAASVLVALLIGGIELLGLLGDRFALTGPFWDAVGRLNDSSGALGTAVILIFALCWAASAALYRWKRLGTAG